VVGKEARGSELEVQGDRTPHKTPPHTHTIPTSLEHPINPPPATHSPRPPGAPELRIDVIDGATHLFSEPGALEAVATKAAEWFAQRFAAVSPD